MVITFKIIARKKPMQELKPLLYIFMGAVIVAASIAKNRLFYHSFPITLPGTLFAWCALCISLFMARRYRLPDSMLYLVIFVLISYSIVTRYCIKYMSCLVIALCSPSKVIFTCILVRFFFKVKLTQIQLFGLFLILFGIVLPNIIIKNHKFSSISLHQICICSFGGLLFGILNLVYEMYQVKNRPYFWDLVFMASIVGSIASTAILVTEILKSNYSLVEIVQTKTTYILLLAEYIELAFKAVLIYIASPIYRSIIVLLLSVFTGMFDTLIFGRDQIKLIDFLAFLIANAGLVVFDFKTLKKIFFHKKIEQKNDTIEKIPPS